jgi:hypothetical protein
MIASATGILIAVPQTPAPEHDVPPTLPPPGPAQPDPPERARVGTLRNGTALTKADMQALDRARKDPTVVERVMVRRGLDRSVVATKPERWPLPSQNGNGGGS